MSDPRIARQWVERVGPGSRERARESLAIEEPLEIRVDGRPIAVTMRTPGDDEELAVGFLAGEGLVATPDDVASVGLTEDLAANTVEVRTRAGLSRALEDEERRFYLTSSCGVCGKGALEFVRRAAPRSEAGPAIPRAVVIDAPLAARRAQRAFEATGGLHAAAVIDPTGESLVLREDVGRHNALDKALGHLLLTRRYPLPGRLAVLSGRASFELIQKAALARLAGVIAVGAPSTLAVSLAREQGMLLCGFVRDGRFNVYAGSKRLGD